MATPADKKKWKLIFAEVTTTITTATPDAVIHTATATLATAATPTTTTTANNTVVTTLKDVLLTADAKTDAKVKAEASKLEAKNIRACVEW